MNLAWAAGQAEEQILRWRRELHQTPELSGKEEKTTGYLAAELEKMGIPCRRFDRCFGLMGTIEGGHPGKTVLLRADIDALPIRENTGLPYASGNGAMHACGHDGHMAILLGAAKLLADRRENLHGTVRLLFQPAEESTAGAKACMAEGCLDGVDAAFGGHIWSDMEAPYIDVTAGPRLAASDRFVLTVRGKSAHGAMPHLGCDGVAAAAALVLQLQGYAARRVDPLKPLVLTVGSIHGGTAPNILADTVVLEGIARSFDPQLRAELEGDLAELALAAVAPYGCTAELMWLPQVPAVINRDEELVRLAADAVRRLYGESALRTRSTMMVAEDFACYGERVPTVFLGIGGRCEDCGAVYPHHNDRFTIDEGVLARGAAVYAAFAEDFLNGGNRDEA